MSRPATPWRARRCASQVNYFEVLLPDGSWLVTHIPTECPASQAKAVARAFWAAHNPA